MIINLNKHRSNYLGVGWHRVKIMAKDNFQYNSGSDGVSYTYKDVTGKTGKTAFVMVEAAFWVLADFCEALGITTKEMDNFTEDMPIDRKAWVRIEKNGKYNETVEWASDSEQAPTHGGSKTEEKSRSFETSNEGTGPVDDEEDPIPF